MRRTAGFPVEERGSALFVVSVLAITATIIVGAYLSSSLGKIRHVEAEVADSSAFNAAESGLNAAVEAVWTAYHLAPAASRIAAVDHLDGKYDATEQLRIDGKKLGRSDFRAWVRQVHAVGTSYADVQIVAQAGNAGAARSITAVVRYGRKPSAVFNHAYFINNFGWLWGSGITVNGSVRSNGNFSLKGATVNGDIYAAENSAIGAAGTIDGDSTNLDTAGYNSTYDTRARPTNPSAPSEDLNGNGKLDPGEDTNGNGALDTYDYPGGYDGKSERHAGEDSLEMPYLGDLSIYRELANTRNGTIKQGGVTVVNHVMGDDLGESKNLVLVGTEANPIVIDGPVVIEGDVVIKGVVTGRGTIYAGRNVHVVGNLTYLNPPKWEKPLTDMKAAKDANLGKDLVGLAAKGSVILGDYTQDWWKSATSSYQKPPFTQSYEVDPTDASNGYVTSTVDGKPTFNGDYTAYDGGKKANDAGTGFVDRRFYESSFSDATIHALAGSEYVTQVDAVIYTNHLLSGRIGDCTFNGTLVSRDEAMIYSGSLLMNYDVRVRDNGYEYIDIFLPREPTYRILYWSEGNPE